MGGDQNQRIRQVLLTKESANFKNKEKILEISNIHIYIYIMGTAKRKENNPDFIILNYWFKTIFIIVLQEWLIL